VAHAALDALSEGFSEKDSPAVLFAPLDARTGSSLAQKLQIPSLMLASEPLEFPAAPASPRSAIAAPLHALYNAATSVLSTSPELARDAAVRKSLGLPPSRGAKAALAAFEPQQLPYLAAFHPAVTGCSTQAGTSGAAATGHVVGYLSPPAPARRVAPAPPSSAAHRVLATFLAAGAPPVAVLLAAPRDAPGFDRASALGAVRLATEEGAARAVVVWPGAPAHLSGALSAALFVAPAAPLAWLLPQCAAAVHAGDSRSASAALRAGVPALVLADGGALAADANVSKFWAQRVEALGAGVNGSKGSSGGGEWSAAALTAGLAALRAPQLAARARAVAEAARASGGAAYAAEVARAVLGVQAHCGTRFAWCGFFPRALVLAEDPGRGEAACRACARRCGDEPTGSTVAVDSDFCRACGAWTCPPCLRALPFVPGQPAAQRAPVCALCLRAREPKEPEERWEGEAGRCERCRTYFPSRAAMLAAPCAAHPGKMLDRYFRWSCCSQDAEDAPPCRVYQQHRQCRTTLAAIERMGVAGEAAAPGGMDALMAEKVAAIAEEEAKAAAARVVRVRAAAGGAGETEDYFEHHYAAGETLPGIALRYGVTVAQLKRANSIVHGNLDPGRKVLRVPKRMDQAPPPRAAPPPVSKEDQLVRVLVAAAREEGLALGRQEARFYLADAAGNVGGALAQYRDDLRWEQDNAPPPGARVGGAEDDAGCGASTRLLGSEAAAVGGRAGGSGGDGGFITRIGQLLGF
jgi:UDP:flavonoid glycosyltransferase YjiC (YdhE family)/LysM repeat protein